MEENNVEIKEKNNNNVVLYIVVIVAILLIGIGVGYFLYNKKEIKESNSSLNISINKFTNDFKNGEIIEANIGYETFADNPWTYLEYELEYSNGLEYVETATNGSKVTLIEQKKKFKYNIDNLSIIDGGEIKIKFKVIDSSKDLYIKLKNIYYIDKNGDKYKNKDILKQFYSGGILYKCNYDSNAFWPEMRELVWYSYEKQKDINCIETDITIEKGYDLVKPVYNDKKIVLFKNNKYYIYDAEKKSFVFESKEVVTEENGAKYYPLSAFSYIDKTTDDKNAFGIYISPVHLYINLETNAAYYDLKANAANLNTISDHGPNYSIRINMTNGKLIKYYSFGSKDSYGFFDGNSFKFVIRDMVVSHSVNDLNNYVLYTNNSNEILLYDNKGNKLFNSTSNYYEYFSNPLNDVVIYKLYDNKSDNKVYISNYKNDLYGTIQDEAFSKYTTSAEYDAAPRWYYDISFVKEENINGCYDKVITKTNEMTNYVFVMISGVDEDSIDFKKIYKLNKETKMYEFYKNVEYCQYNNED